MTLGFFRHEITQAGSDSNNLNDAIGIFELPTFTISRWNRELISDSIDILNFDSLCNIIKRLDTNIRVVDA